MQPGCDIMLSHREHPNKTVICLIFKEIIMIHVATELNRGWWKFHQSSIAPSMWLNFLPAFWHWHSWFSIITSLLTCGLLFVAWDSAMVWDSVDSCIPKVVAPVRPVASNPDSRHLQVWWWCVDLVTSECRWIQVEKWVRPTQWTHCVLRNVTCTYTVRGLVWNSMDTLLIKVPFRR